MMITQMQNVQVVLGAQTMSENIPNIAMADALMKIFGLKRVSPTDKELKEKYKETTNGKDKHKS